MSGRVDGNKTSNQDYEDELEDRRSNAEGTPEDAPGGTEGTDTPPPTDADDIAAQTSPDSDPPPPASDSDTAPELNFDYGNNDDAFESDAPDSPQFDNLESRRGDAMVERGIPSKTENKQAPADEAGPKTAEKVVAKDEAAETVAEDAVKKEQEAAKKQAAKQAKPQPLATLVNKELARDGFWKRVGKSVRSLLGQNAAEEKKLEKGNLRSDQKLAEQKLEARRERAKENTQEAQRQARAEAHRFKNILKCKETPLTDEELEAQRKQAVEDGLDVVAGEKDVPEEDRKKQRELMRRGAKAESEDAEGLETETDDEVADAEEGGKARESRDKSLQEGQRQVKNTGHKLPESSEFENLIRQKLASGEIDDVRAGELRETYARLAEKAIAKMQGGGRILVARDDAEEEEAVSELVSGVLGATREISSERKGKNSYPVGEREYAARHAASVTFATFVSGGTLKASLRLSGLTTASARGDVPVTGDNPKTIRDYSRLTGRRERNFDSTVDDPYGRTRPYAQSMLANLGTTKDEVRAGRLRLTVGELWDRSLS